MEKVVVEIGKGVSYEVDEEGILVINIDTKVDFGLSSTGKSTIIASSSAVSYTHLTLPTTPYV